MKTAEIVIPRLLPGLNGKEGLIRAHHMALKKQKETIKWEIVAGMTSSDSMTGLKGIAKFEGQVRIVYTRYTTHLMDWDNHCSSFKLLGDAMVELGILTDDKPSIIVEFVPKQVHVRKIADRKTVIEIECLTLSDNLHILAGKTTDHGKEYISEQSRQGQERIVSA